MNIFANLSNDHSCLDSVIAKKINHVKFYALPRKYKWNLTVPTEIFSCVNFVQNFYSNFSVNFIQNIEVNFTDCHSIKSKTKQNKTEDQFKKKKKKK